MAKLTLTDESSGFQTTAQRNANYSLIEAALENTLSRDGTSPNAMLANLDMNSKRVINLAAPEGSSDAARLIDVLNATVNPSVWTGNTLVADTIAVLRALTGVAEGTYIFVAGYYVKGDLGGGWFYYSSGSSATQDNGAVITPNTLPGRFLRVVPPIAIPQMWGAKADGSTDDSAAVQACCNYQNNGYSGGASSGTFSVRQQHFPAGIYRLGTTVTIYGSAALSGERAIIKPDSGVTGFTVSATYQNKFNNLVFVGGATGIKFDTGNVDTSTVTIENCEFQDQTASHIYSTAVSASTTYRVVNCKFYSLSTSTSFYGIDLRGGNLSLKSCWVTSSQTFVRNGDGTTGEGGVVYLDDMFGVPQATGNGGCIWVYNTAELVMTNCRLGGEDEAICVYVARNFNPGVENITRLNNCTLFSGDQPIIYFDVMPKIFWMKNCIASSAGWDKGFFFSSLADTFPSQVRGYTHSFIVENNIDNNSPVYQGATKAISKTATLSQNYKKPSSDLLLTSIVKSVSVDGGGSWSTTLSNASASASTDTFGATCRLYSGTSASYIGQFTDIHGTVLSGLATGMYTVHFSVEVVTENILSIGVYAGANEAVIHLPKGRHEVCIPTYHVSGTDSNRCGIFAENMNSTQNVKVSRLRVYKGVVEQSSTHVHIYGTAAPTTLHWEVGDRVINSTPTAGQPKAWVCTVAGIPGTWVSEGTL